MWLVRNRLAHFCALGALLFAIAPRERRTVELSGQTLAALHAAEAARIAPRPLDGAHAREVDARAIEDELLYREALRLSLDKGDPIVRQRLIQKLLLLVEDLGGASRTPSEAELRAFFESRRSEWRRPPRIHFIHVFARTKDALPARELLPDTRTPPVAGEPFPYSRDVTASVDEIARVYGSEFRDSLGTGNARDSLGAGDAREARDGWSDPMRSNFGWHRVRVIARLPGAPAAFEEVRKSLELEYLLVRREKIVGDYLRKLAAGYSIVIDGQALDHFTPTRRVAVRADPSSED